MSEEIAKLIPALPDAPGWILLSKEKQDRLWAITSRLLRAQAMEGLSILAQCTELLKAREVLENEHLTFTNYTATVFRQGFRTAWRRLADFEELRKYWPEEITKTLAERGATLLRGAAGGGMRELINVAKMLPPPKGNDQKIIDGFIEKKVRTKLREGRQQRNKKGQSSPEDKEATLKRAFNKVVHIMRGTDFRSTDQQREWLATLVGYVMQRQSIPGFVRTGRKEIPNGFVPRRGPKPKDPG